MRLICPNCDARYEVPDSVIPPEGRDVQCSDCGQTWFQHHADHVPQPAPEPAEPDFEEEPAPPEPGAQRQELDPSIQDILREEAEREVAARSADAFESQPDLGLDTAAADARSRETQDRMARLRGQDPEAETVAAVAAASSRRDLLPDIEEINSTLRSTNDRQHMPVDVDEDDDLIPPRRSSFWRGFIYVTALFAVFACIYVFAPQIAEAVPNADPWISTYVTWVDNMRVWVGHMSNDLVEWLDETAASQN